MSLVGGGHLQGYWNSCLLKYLLLQPFYMLAFFDVLKKNSSQILSLNQNINIKQKLERWLVGLEFTRENNKKKDF